MEAFVLDKLFAVSGGNGKAFKLCNTSQARRDVVNMTLTCALALIPIDQRSRFTVMADNCHANFILVCHVTVHGKGLVPPFSIRIYYVRSTDSL